MGQFGPDQEFADQAFYEPIVVTNAFLNALFNPDAEFNIVIEITGALTDAVPQAFEPEVDMGFSDQTLEPIPSELTTDPPTILLRFASRVLNWRPDDEYAPNGYAEVRLATRSFIESSINLAPGTTNASALSVGAAIISDKDHFIGPIRAKYNFEGRPARFLWGPWLNPRKDYRVLSDTVSGVFSRSEDGRSRLSFEDSSYRLNSSIQPRVFGGMGLLDGTPDMLGQRLPIWFGIKRQVEPRMVDPSIRLRLATDGSMTQIFGGFYGGHPAIYDGDVPTVADLVDEALSNNISPGGFMSCNAFGAVIDRPGGGIDSPFTLHAHGEGPTQPGSLIAHIMARAGVQPFEVDLGSFAQMNTGEAGYYYSGANDETVKSIVEKFAVSGGGRIAPDLLLRGLALIPPEDQNFIDEFVHGLNGEVTKMRYAGRLSRPVLEYLVRFNYADRVLSADEILLPNEYPEAKALAQLQFETFSQEAQLVRAKYGNSVIRRVEHDILLNNRADAAAVQRRYSDFYKVPRDLYHVKLPARAMSLLIGSVIKIYSDVEEAFKGGRKCLLIANRREFDDMSSRALVLI